MKTIQTDLALFLIMPFLILVTSCGIPEGPLEDEAYLEGKKIEDFRASRVDVAAGMDGGISLTPEEVEGRNTWTFFTGGNERFWNLMAQEGYSLVDFLHLLDSRERDTRFGRLGLLTEPGMKAASGPDKYGLYLDQVDDPLAGALDPEVYGEPSGIIGLRIFPNPDFDEAAEQRWDAERFYEDTEYATDPFTVRPYRVGMTCAFCHVAPSPVNPPENVEQPEWAELSGTIGNQYFRNGEIFGFHRRSDDLFYHHLKSVLPGTVDTSIMATDYNNNPNIINAIYNIEDRLEVAWEHEVDDAAQLLAPHTETRRVPHVLVDGADNIGTIGALARVFINIGVYSEEWLRCHNPILGGRPQEPIRIEGALEKSIYWQATVERMPNLARYLARAAQPFPLTDAPQGAAYLKDSAERIEHGKQVFAENCYACHSSKQPDMRWDQDITEIHEWSRDPEYLAYAREAVQKKDFRQDNFLSTDERIPITLVQTNAGRALQNNGTTGRIWEDFTSITYKSTPSVGSIKVEHPFTGESSSYEMPAGGPGFYRVPSLVSLWTSAPFLHNNALGEYHHDPSTEARMAAFDDSIRRLLWPERRDGVESIARTTERAWLYFPANQLPVILKGKLGPAVEPLLRMPWLLPGLLLLSGIVLFWIAAKSIDGKGLRRLLQIVALVCFLFGFLAVPLNFFAAGKLGDLRVGPIPAGTPINLLVNLDAESSPPADVLQAVYALWSVGRTIEKENMDDDAGLQLLGEVAADKLLAVSKSPDFVRDRGHYFGTQLSDEEKEALIAFLKTL